MSLNQRRMDACNEQEVSMEEEFSHDEVIEMDESDRFFDEGEDD